MEGLQLALVGSNTVHRHFAAEYGKACVTTSTGAHVFCDVGFAGSPPPGDATFAGGHKGTRWAVGIASSADDLHTVIRLRGRPRAFVLSLVQGYVVEPLLSVAAAESGSVLVPSAAVLEPGNGALLLLGASRSGKTTLSVRALAAGRRILGDDQVAVDSTGLCRSVARRLRLYSDLRTVAPQAYERLPLLLQRRLAALAALRAATRGFVAPSVPVDPGLIGPTGSLAAPLGRIVTIERSSDVTDFADVPSTPGAACALAASLLADQRRWIARATAPAWSARLERAAELERTVLERAFAQSEVRRIVVPGTWDAPRALTALAARLGTERAAGA